MSELSDDFYTLVVRLPKDQERRNVLLTVLRLGNKFHGGEITAAGKGDLITELERYEYMRDNGQIPDTEEAAQAMKQLASRDYGND